MNIEGSSVQISENNQNGIYVENAHLTITGRSKDGIDSLLDITKNGTTPNQNGNGILFGGSSTVDIKNTKGKIDGNAWHGIHMGDMSSSTLNIDNSGLADKYDDVDIYVSRNTEGGILIGNENTVNIINSNVSVLLNGYKVSDDDKSIKANDVADGINLSGSSHLNIQSQTDRNHIFEVKSNTRDGIAIYGGEAVVKDMYVSAGGNGNYDIYVANGGKLDMSSSTGAHKLDFFDHSGGFNPKSNLVVKNGGIVNVTNMDVISQTQYEGDEKFSNILVDNATLNIKGDNNNIRMVRANDTFVTNNKGNIQIENMNILGDGGESYAQTNGRGIETIGGTTSIVGNGTNLMMIQDADTSESTIEGTESALYVSASGNQRGRLTIQDMDIGLRCFDKRAIEVQDSDVKITSNHNNVLYMMMSHPNIGIEAVQSNATVSIDGMRIVNEGPGLAVLKGTTDALGQKTADLNISNSTILAANIFYGANSAQPKDYFMFDMQNAQVTLNNADIVDYDGYWRGYDWWETSWQPSRDDRFYNYINLIKNDSTSTFTATDSALVGAIVDNGHLTATLTRSNWKMWAPSRVNTLKMKDLTLDMRGDLLHPYNTLTIKDSLAVDNVDILMNTNLDEPGTSDKIIFLDGARMTGSALLHITNTAPLGSHGTFITGDGIKVVDAQGSAVTGAQAFDLAGKKIDTGAYVQELFYQNMGTNDESWYLRTVTEEDGGGNKSTNGSFSNGKTALKTDLANSVAGMPVVALSVIKTINSELRNRLGELRSNNPRSMDGLWARGYYKSLEVDENIKNEMDIYGFEAGYDHLIAKDARNRTYMGIMAGYAQLDNLKITQVNDHNGKGDGSVPSVGAYLTWVNKNGWYTDAVVRGFLTQMDITNYSAQGQAITHDADRMAVSGSFEFGRRSSVYQNGRNGFILEPKAQIAYTFMPSKDEKTNLGQKINYDATNSLVTRGAIMAAYRRVMRNGMVFEPYVQVGVAYEWLGETDVEFDGAKFTSDVSGATFEGAIGLNARLSRGWHLYGDVNLEQGSVYKSWGGHLGVRYNF